MRTINNTGSFYNREFSFARDYHETTKSVNDFIGKEYNKNIEYKIYPNAEKIKLVNLDKYFDNDFAKYIMNRKSTREFTNKAVTLEQVSCILSMCYGLRDESGKEFRTVPSAGARFPLELYVVVLNAKDIQHGIYHYEIKNNQLEKIRTGDFREEIYEYSNFQKWIYGYSIAIIITAIFDRTMSKYGERGYRYILIDAGHVGQNLYLASAYLGLGAVTIGGFNDNKINQMIGVDGVYETSIYMGLIGTT